MSDHTAESEVVIMRNIQVAASLAGHRLLRNNIGMAWTKDGRPVRFGVGNPGGSDLVGWTKRGRFLAIEVKTITGKPTVEQLSFIAAVQRAGGIAGVARSVDEALAIIGDN